MSLYIYGRVSEIFKYMYGRLSAIFKYYELFHLFEHGPWSLSIFFIDDMPIQYSSAY